MDLGADLCCDSAHKTLPVLTGGAYLHVSPRLQLPPAAVRDALALFGSTSPSYLILQSLDLANPFLERLPDLLEALLPKLDAARRQLTAAGYRLYGSEPLKLTLDLRRTKTHVGTSIACPQFTAASDQMRVGTSIACPQFIAPPDQMHVGTSIACPQSAAEPDQMRVGTSIACPQSAAEPDQMHVGTSIACPQFTAPPDQSHVGTSIACPPFEDRCLTGTALARHLEAAGIWCEFADPDFLVCMLTPRTTDEDLARLLRCLCALRVEIDPACPDAARPEALIETVCSIREAMLAPCVRVSADDSLGKVLARPGVSCPPAVPIRMPGERIDEAALAAFRTYGITACDVIME